MSELMHPLTPPANLEPTVPPAAAIDAPASNANWDLKNLLQRPEMVALLAFALILLFWDTYMDWMAADDFTQPITGVKLARRLGISPSTLSRYKGRSNFSEWSQDLDPDGIAWVYEGKGFVPRLIGNGE